MKHTKSTKAFIEYLGLCPWCILDPEVDGNLLVTANIAVDEGFCEKIVLKENDRTRYFFMLTEKGEALQDWMNL